MISKIILRARWTVTVTCASLQQMLQAFLNPSYSFLILGFGF
jgi:hypothetical protein